MGSIFSAALLAAGAAAAAKYIKGKDFDDFTPQTIAKKVTNAVKLTYDTSEPYDNGVALTPPMGWSSWNLFRNRINEDLIYETARL